MATVLSPVFASAQVTFPQSPLGSGNFYDLVGRMAADADGLYSHPYDNPADPRDLSTKNNIHFNDNVGFEVWGNNNVFGAGYLNFVRIPNLESFGFSSALNVGYLGNESTHDNELYISVFNQGGGMIGGQLLFDYDAGDHIVDPVAPDDIHGIDSNDIDTAPLSYSFATSADVSAIFTHVSRTSTTEFTSAAQIDPMRFTFWGGVALDDEQNLYFTGDFLLGISDNDTGFDGDVDDGLFYIQGADLTRVPEPSQIATIALLGVGALLVIRKRFLKKK